MPRFRNLLNGDIVSTHNPAIIRLYRNLGYEELPDIEEVKDTGTNMEKFYNRKINSITGARSVEGLIGLEIECEGKNLCMSPFKYWTIHEDNSLRDAGGPPLEYVLKKPLSFDETIQALHYLDTELKSAGSKFVYSHRTSVHVHINCTDLTLRQLYCFICLYYIFEEILVDWSGPDRIGNCFCLRAKDSDFILQMLERAISKASLRDWNENYRYAACNIASINKFGSLEFRSLRGTVDISIIKNWIEMLLLIREKSLLYDNPKLIVEEFQRLGPLPFFKKIFSTDRLRNLLEDIPGVSGKLWDGMRMMRDVAYSCEWEPPQKKKEGQQESELKNFPYNEGDFIMTPWGEYEIQRCANTQYNFLCTDVNWDTWGLSPPYRAYLAQGLNWLYINPVDKPDWDGSFYIFGSIPNED